MPRTATAGGEIKFEYGQPQVFALKFLTAKGFDGSFGPRGLFTAADEGFGERKIWLDAEDASDIEREIRALGIRTGEPIRVTKIRQPRGGGHSFRVERPSGSGSGSAAPARPSREEMLLEQSVAIARTEGPQAFRHNAHVMPSPPAEAPAPPINAKFLAAYMVSVDVLLETRAYAQRKGLALDIRCEDVRALAATLVIDQQKCVGAR
jgi:hypothetical protein